MIDESKAVNILYTNYHGQTATRRIVPERLWHGVCEWHGEAQWLLDAIDVDRPEKPRRTFALANIHEWGIQT